MSPIAQRPDTATARLDWRWAAGLFLLIWLPAAWINLEPFRLGHMDTWCYFAPAAAAPAPFQLTMPFLGSWEAADQSWGLHWPGSLWLASSIIPWFGPHGMTAGAAWYLLLWLALAELTRRLAVRVTGDPWVGLASAILILTDRLILENAAVHRPEIPAALALVGAVLAFPATPQDKPSAVRLSFLALCGFGLAILHPLTFLLGGLAVSALLGAGLLRRQLTNGTITLMLAYSAGFITLVAWLFADPIAYSQFLAHAKLNAGGLVSSQESPWLIGRILERYPFSWVAALLFLAGTTEALLQWRRIDSQVLLAGLILLFCLFYNFFYVIVILPFFFIQALELAWKAGRALSSRWYRLWVAGVSGLVLVHGAAFVQSAVLYFCEGMPNLPAATRNFIDNIPPSRRLVLPWSLWEAGLYRKNREIFVNTPPFNMPGERRLAYEGGWMAQLEDGDIVVVGAEGDWRDRLRRIGTWEVVGSWQHPLPSFGEPSPLDYEAWRLVKRR